MENGEKARKVIAVLFKLPEAVEEALSAEAVRERRSRQGQLIRILEERYSLTTEAVEEGAA